MTLLVIGIRVPSGTSAETLGHALRGLGSSCSCYGISFIVIGLYWLGYHRQLHFSWILVFLGRPILGASRTAEPLG